MSLKALKLITIILLLILLVILTRAGCRKVVQCFKKPTADTVIVHDTTWLVRDSIIYKEMVVTETIYDIDTLPPQYIPDTNYPKLKAQYETLVQLFLSKNIYRDTIMIDSIGYVTITDTVQHNTLNNRAFTYSYKIPQVTETVTIVKPEVKRNELYIGGGINTFKVFVPFSLEAGLMLKTKRDHLYGLKVGSDINRQVYYGFQSYWKIGKKNN
jgi:hypothetical protein